MHLTEPRVQPPMLEAYSDLPLYNTKAVVHQTGVPAPTLRAWERRYGILAPRRSENDYRLYSERDMILVGWLRERVENGMTISQAIALMRTLEPARRRSRRARAAESANAAAQSTQPPHVPDFYALNSLSSVLQEHFAQLREQEAVRTIAQALAVYSVEETCLHLLQPALVEIGRRWAEGSVAVTVEHFAAAVIRALLDGLFRSAPASEGGPLVLVGCAEGELHELGALMLALFLRRAGLRVAYLGQSVAGESLVATVAALRPSCVALSVTVEGHVPALAEAARQLAIRPGAPFFCFGGQAFEAHPELAQDIGGGCFGGDARRAVDEIKRRLVMAWR